MCGPNRSTGLGQLTADQSRGTRRYAALTADPREPIASIRASLPSILFAEGPRSTLSLTRDSRSRLPFDDDAPIHLTGDLRQG